MKTKAKRKTHRRRRLYRTKRGYYWATPAEQRRRPKSKRGKRATIPKRWGKAPRRHKSRRH